MGITAHEAAVWKQAVDSADEVVRAKRLGLEAEQSKWFADRGGDVRRWADWLWAGVDDVESAAAWVAADERPESARAWLNRGFSLDDAVEWRREGRGPRRAAWERWRGRDPQHRAWLDAGARDVQQANEWRSLGSIDDMRAWLHIGVDDPEHARRLLDHGVDREGVLRWRSLGLRSPNEVVKNARFWPGGPEEAARWVEAGCADANEARSWYQLLDEPEQVARWNDAGFGEPQVVAEWLEHGFDAQSAAKWSSGGFTPGDAGAWVASGTSFEDASTWAQVGAPTAAQALRLQDAGVGLTELARWRSLGVVDTEDVLDHSAYWGHPEEAARWVEVGLADAHEARRWRDVIDSPGELMTWLQAGFRSVDEALPWIDRDVAPDEAARWRDAGHGLGSPEKANRWRAAGFDAASAVAWVAGGVRDPAEAQSLVDEGLAADDVRQWRALGAGSIESIRTWSATWDLEQAIRWCEEEPLTEGHGWWQALDGDLQLREALLEHDITDLEGFHQLRTALPGGPEPSEVVAACARFATAGISIPGGALAWLRVGDVGHAVEWASAGVTEPVKSAAWTSHGFTPQLAEPWLAAGFVHPAGAEEWRAASVPPTEAARWKPVVSDPSEMDRWRSVGADDPDDVRRWKDLDVDEPTRVEELLRVGLALPEYASLMEGIDEDRRRLRLREYCFERAGLTLEDDVPTWTVENVQPDTILERVTHITSAAYRAGESWVRLRHTWPRWQPEFLEVLPDARYVRGHEALEVHRLTSEGLMDERTEVAGVHLEDRSSVLVELASNSRGDELFVLEETST